MSDSLAARPSKRGLVIALVISVAFNLFALGFIAARALRPAGTHGPHAMHGPFMGPRGLMREGFGSEAAPMIDKIMERHGDDLRKERVELRQARGAVRDALLREPLDPGQLQAALSSLRARTGSGQARMHEALVELARSLPLEQRKLLARRALALEALGLGAQSPAPPPHPGPDEP